MKLGSMEYLQEVMKRSNADEKYRALAKGQFETYTLVLEAEPDKGVKEPVIVGFDCRDGEFVDIWQGAKPTLFTLSAPYGTWVDVLRGKLGATKAITMRKLKVQGPFLQLLKGGERVLHWVEILRTIPTEFEGDYAQYNIPGKAQH
ncbi:MAG: SCP2 sterol-binding domain-containing protein [Chloroflexi bacterium]|nr:SCP2 sterol-binding domain-containing protein [Chloroflexota bacterium]